MADRISNLEYTLQLKILEFLPIKVAGMTSVLSKKWKHLWMKMKNFDIDNRRDSGEELVALVIYMNIHHSLLIDRFKLVMSSGYYRPNLLYMLNFAFKRNPVEVEIIYDCDSPLEIPKFVLNKSLSRLVTLKLEGAGIKVEASLSRYCLFQLKTLHLKNVCYRNEGVFDNIIINSPKLEELVMLRRNGDNLETLWVRSDSLRRFELEIPWDCRCDEIVLWTPGLRSLKMKDQRYVKHRLTVGMMMPELKEAFLDIINIVDAKSLIKGIKHVETLEWCLISIDLSFMDRFERNYFHNLSLLKVCNCQHKSSSSLISRMRRISPKMKEVKTIRIDDHDDGEEVEVVDKEKLP